MEPAWLVWARVLQAIAQTGLTFTTGTYDRERYTAVSGGQALIEFHILNRIGDAPHDIEMHERIKVKFELVRTKATIVGFHSTRHRGVFTPGDSNIHIHFQTPDNSQSGHIEKLKIGGGARLCLPAT